MTNIPISTALYEVIEKEYMLFEGNKQTFCKAYKENANGLAERIATKEDTLIKEILLEADKQIQLLKQKISSLQEMNEKLARDLAQEQGWAPVTISNMSADDYNELKSATHSAAMLPQQASDWISQCFGFNVHRIKILTEIPAYEKDRHGCLRKCGTEDREPFYYSTDWNYIAFTAAGLSYEIVNGDLYFTMVKFKFSVYKYTIYDILHILYISLFYRKFFWYCPVKMTGYALFNRNKKRMALCHALFLFQK